MSNQPGAVHIQVIAKGNGSLRDKIVKDAKLEDYGLRASEQKRQGRPYGWAKLLSTKGAQGAINLQWHGSSKLLICRVVNRLGGKPHSITGDFVDYLVACNKARIHTIQIVPL